MIFLFLQKSPSYLDERIPLNIPKGNFILLMLYTPYMRFIPKKLLFIGLIHPIAQFWLYKPVLQVFVFAY